MDLLSTCCLQEGETTTTKTRTASADDVNIDDSSSSSPSDPKNVLQQQQQQQVDAMNAAKLNDVEDDDMATQDCTNSNGSNKGDNNGDDQVDENSSKKKKEGKKTNCPFDHVLTQGAIEELKLYEQVLFDQQYSKDLPPVEESISPDNKQQQPRRKRSYYDWNDITIDNVLGQGSFSFVFQVSFPQVVSPSDCINTSSASGSAPAAALKCLKASSISSEEDFIHNAMDLYSEAQLLERLAPHPHIIQLMGKCRKGLAESFRNDENDDDDDESNDGVSRSSGYFVLLEIMAETLQDKLMEWRNIPDDRIFDKMRTKPQILQRLEAVALPVLDAMEYLHSKHIVLRDLKPENIGFDQKAGEVKLFDFGLARHVDLLKEETDMAGSILYMAPEVLQMNDTSTNPNSLLASGGNSLPSGTAISYPSDVYSFAIVVWELCTLDVPLRKFTTLEEVQINVGQKKWRPNLSTIPSSKIKTLLSKIWKQTPTDRPTFTELRIPFETILGRSSKTSIRSGTKETVSLGGGRTGSSGSSSKRSQSGGPKRRPVGRGIRLFRSSESL